MEIKIGGVPEHFNLPWHIANEEGVFEELGIDLSFIDYAGGTGAMTQALLAQEIDLALLLTEGAVKFITDNPTYKIIKIYVDSPLMWGVHTAAKTEGEAKKLPFAISRYGSGSHLMAYVHAQNKGWNTENLQFEVVSTLAGVRESFKNGLDALFMWEKFTTKPFVDNGEMKCIDYCPTPWPCFVLVAHQAYIQEFENELENLCDGINMCLDTFKERPNLAAEIADEYELKIKNVHQWLADTEWNSSNEIDAKMLQNVLDTLFDLKITDQKTNPKNLISSLSILTD